MGHRAKAATRGSVGLAPFRELGVEQLIQWLQNAGKTCHAVGWRQL